MTENEFARRIENLGGHAYAVGGWVRDLIMGRVSSDKDYVVTGITGDSFARGFPDALCAGNSFPVYLLKIDEEKREVAFARREYKTGSGYRGFSVVFDPSVTIEEDLFRRDLTINSIACSLPDGAIIDPFGGRADIKNKLVRATSGHFSEDPVRALRAARLSAQLEFTVETRTIGLMRGCGEELKNEPAERVFRELEKALASRRPSIFFRNLNMAGLMEIIFPWLLNPADRAKHDACSAEDSVFEHSMETLDKVSQMTGRLEVRFAALARAAARGETTAGNCRREKDSPDILREIGRKMRLPRLWKRCAAIVAEEHQYAPCLVRPREVRDLLVAVSKHPIGFDGFNAVIMADCGFLPGFLAEREKYMSVIEGVRRIPVPEGLDGREIGAWRRRMETEALAKVMSEDC